MRTFFKKTTVNMSEYAGKDAVLQKSKSLIAFFYLSLFLLSLVPSSVFTGTKLADAVSSGAFDPAWPVFWLRFVDVTLGASLIQYFFIGSALLAALYYKKKAVRILSFLGLLQFHALGSSFISFFPHWYLWIYGAFLFIFLPDIWKNDSEESRRKVLLVIFGGQLFAMTTYFAAGVSKLGSAFSELISGGSHLFAVDATAYQIADWLLRTETESPLGSFLIENSLLSETLMLLILYVQVFALWALVKPRLHRVWGVALILFHIGSYLALNIFWLPAVAYLAVFFLHSPFFEGEARGFKKIVSEIPPFGLFSRLGKRWV